MNNIKTFFEKELKTKIDKELYQLLVKKYQVGNADIAWDLLESCNENEKQNAITSIKNNEPLIG
jgi:hypothetical protein